MTNNKYLSLPTELEDITQDWLETALRYYSPEIQLKSFEIVDMVRATCTKIRLKLNLENNHPRKPIPETVILKGGFEQHSRPMGFMHKSEAMSYATLTGAVGLRTPIIYFSGWDEAAQQGIVIMEDLVARGVDWCSPVKPQSYEQITQRLKALAKLHAQTWQSPELEAGGKWDWLRDTPQNLPGYFAQFTEEDVWNSFINSPRGAAVSTRFHDRHWMRDAMDRIAVFSRDLPLCACHGDTHLGNLYIDIDGEPGFFDCISYKAPAMYEITYHLCCALDLADRPRLEAALIQYYLDELRSHGIDAPSFDEALYQYGVYLAHGYLIFIINDSIFQPEAYNTAYAARFSQAMLDHDTMGKLAAIKN